MEGLTIEIAQQHIYNALESAAKAGVFGFSEAYTNAVCWNLICETLAANATGSVDVEAANNYPLKA